MHTPNRKTPAGIKGMAEGGVMGAIGAVTNAVNDALAPFGVRRRPAAADADVPARVVARRRVKPYRRSARA